MRTVTLDTNSIGIHHWHKVRPELDFDTIIYLPDIMLAEKFKSEARLNEARQDLARLYDFKELVQCAPGRPYYMDREMETGEPTQSALAYISETRSLRKLIADCANAPKEALRVLAGVPEHAQIDLSSRLQTVLTGVANMDLMVKDLQAEIDHDTLTACALDERKIPDALINTNFREMAIGILKLLPSGSSFDPVNIANSQGAWIRYFYSTLAYTIKSHIQPEYAMRSHKRLLNDTNDEDIVLVGSFTDRLFTFDPMATYVNNAVRACIARNVVMHAR